MTFTPIDVSVEIPSTGQGTLHIQDLIDKSGNVPTVLDIDLGFSVSGSVKLPGWISGKGVVRLTADEIGGPVDKTIGEADFSVTGATTAGDPPVMEYPWSIEVIYPALDDDTKLYRFGLVFLLRTDGGGHTDIGGFYDLGAFLVV